MDSHLERLEKPTLIETLQETLFKKGFSFKGRSSSREYLAFTSFHLLYVFLTYFIPDSFFEGTLGVVFVSVPLGLFSLYLVICSVSVLVRRIHDTGRSGWLSLVILIPLVGLVYVIMWIFADPDPQENEWGHPPAF